MGGLAGTEIKAAFKKASAWGTAVACGANDGILLLPTSVKRSAEVSIDDSLGTFYSKDGTPGMINVGGDIPAYLRYDGQVLAMLAQLMGSNSAPAQQGGTAAYTSTLSFATALDGIFGTFAMNMKNYIREVPSLKIIGATIKGEAGKPLEISFQTLGDNFVIDSAVNTLLTFANVTYFETANRVRFADGVFRINDQTAAALDDTMKVYPSSFEIKIMRKLEGRHTGQYLTTAGSAKQELIDEPQTSGMPEVTVKLTFPRHTATTWMSALGTDTRKKMDIKFTGGLIADTYYRYIRFLLPNLQMVDDEVTDEQGIITEPISFIAHGCDVAPAGFSALTPITIGLMNRRSTSYLA
jgi:hypothetical protein